MDNFRAISILLIIWGHCLFIDKNLITYLYHETDLFFINFLKGNTALFVFVTGYLTPIIFWNGEFNYQKFLNDKVKKIIIPYLFMTTMGFMLFFLFGMDLHLNYNIQGLSYYVQWVSYVGTGGAFVGYWYIPFIFIFFILSPFYKKIFELEKEKILLLLIVCIFISLVVHRPYSNANPFHSIIYYSSFFLLGFYVNKNKNFFLKKNVIFVSFLIFIISSLILYFSGGRGNQYKNLFEFNGFDVIVFTKIFLIVFIFGVFEIFLNYKIKILSYFSNVSFSLYFIHTPVIYILSKCFFDGDEFLDTRVWGSFIFFLIVLFFSVFIIFLIKKILKERSKYFIGG